MSWSIRLLYGCLWLFARLPLRSLHWLGAGLGRLAWWRNGRARRVTEANQRLLLAHGAPRLDVANVLRETGKSVLEVAAIWCRPPQRALSLVREVRGEELFSQALQSGRGLIIAAPHLGCWEVLNYWLAARTQLAIVYRPPKQAAMEPLLRKARGGLEVEQVRAEGAGVRSLYKRLAAGGVVGILPDQQPKQGDGEFAPFFGVEALTMVLLPRLAARTGATVLFAFAERLPRAAGYRVHILPAPEGIADSDLRRACSALNRGVEDCVRLAFDQYQWHYKRYSIRPAGSSETPYAAITAG
ncbi:MAG: lipid A biosynthesis acyltransferase [Dokdonella sp.]